MNKVFLSYSRIDIDLANALSKELIRKGYEIIAPHSEVGEIIEDSIKEAIRLADIFIILVSNNSIGHSPRLADEIRILSGLTKKLVIPIAAPELKLSDLTEPFSGLLYRNLESNEKEKIQDLVDSIHTSISKFLGSRIELEEKEKTLKKRREKTAQDYISDTLTELVSSKKKLNSFAQLWYILGYITLLAGIGIAIWFMNLEMIELDALENWGIMIFYGIKNVIIIVLLISSSKYSFNLAKSYMNESLKIAERIHAINFGKFYLQVFDEDIKPEDLKDVFRDWNISSNSSFLDLDSSDFDPKLFEGLANISKHFKK